MLPAEVVKQAMASGWSVDEIAWDQGVTTAEVCRVMRQLEMSREQRRQSLKPPLTLEQRKAARKEREGRGGKPRKDLPLDEVRAARARGETWDVIAERYNVCAKTVRNKLRAAENIE